MRHPAGSLAWLGTERYEVRSCLGHGGMGVVHEVYDRERGEIVAAKRLLAFDPDALYLFKQEFRTLADVRHPNLVRFYEFVQQGDGDAFFTMERLYGVDFVRYARQSGGDTDRLRAAVRQLVEGVRALHDSGKLHRDIKPSNILVTNDGRVVLLDFGVATQMAARPAAAPTPSGEFVGSALYMAPEQADGAPPMPASDWYSVGTVLYEALVGHVPFVGAIDEVLTMKWSFDPEPPSRKVEGVPPDLDALCVALLSRDPSRRPDGAEVLRRLGKASSAPPPPFAGSDVAPFIGRVGPLDVLSRAFEKTRKGQLAAVRVTGDTGMGKSFLVQRFAAEAERNAGAFVLSGRAYEREAVPYKALDGAMDSLSERLIELQSSGDWFDLPADIWALAQVFPVLRRVQAVADAAPRPILDAHAVRAQAVGALAELFTGLASQGPVILFLDDVHWGDVDSAMLLLELVRSPSPPPLLLVMTEREAPAAESAFCATLRERWPAAVPVDEVTVGPLTTGDAEALALAWLEASDERSQRVARAVAREARGSPFLVEELVRSQRARTSLGSTLGVVSLEEMTAERLDKLPADTRAVVELVAVAGRPVRTSVVASACGHPSVEDAIAVLVARRLARTGLRGRFEAVEVAHERIRQTIVSGLEPAVVQASHAKLVRVLVDTPGIDAEEVASHAVGAADPELAARFMERAAAQAFSALAFDRAARLYRRTLELLAPSSSDALRCREGLAEALMYAGRFEESGQVSLEAAEQAPPDRRPDLLHAAARQLLSGGYIQRATAVLRDVLDAVQMRAPRSTLGAVFWLLTYRLWLSFKGLRFQVEVEDQVPTERTRRIDALETFVIGFSIVDPIVGACMQERHLIEALRGTDGFRLLRAFVLAAGHSMSNGAPESPRERALLAAIETLSETAGVEGRRYAIHVQGLTCFHRGRWAEARELLGREVDTLPYGHPGMGFVRLYLLFTSYYTGELKASFTRARRLLAQALDLGDLYMSVNLRATAIAAAFLADDDPDAAQASVRTALAEWPQTTFSVQHWHALLYDTQVHLYAGRGAAAYALLEEQWRPLKGSLLLHGVAVRIPALNLRAMAAIASIADAPDRAAPRVAEARQHATLLAKETDVWASALVALSSAAADNASGDRAAAARNLRLGIERAEATGTRVYVAPATYRLGQILGGAEGRAAIEEARAELAAQGIRNVERWVGMYLPGTWTP